MLEISSISKSFAGKIAIENVTFAVEKGQIFGLLGHNGAGKSTSLGVILGMIYPDAGEVLIDGISVQKKRSQALSSVGSIFESPSFYEYMSGWDNLRILTDYSGGVKAGIIREVVDWVGLTDSIKREVKSYSHGMRQRLALAQALLPMPKVLLLDEPTDGLDPEGIKWFRDFILHLKKDHGVTVLFNSHLLVEVEQMCDRFAILNQGEKVFEGSMHELAGDELRYRIDVDKLHELSEFCSEKKIRIDDNIVSLDREGDVSDLVEALVNQKIKILSVVPVKKSLEDFYLSLTKQKRA